MPNSWWSKKWGKDHICGITHTRLRPGTNRQGIPYVTRLSCTHAFYTKALAKWVETCPTSPPTCPCCREPICKDQLNGD